MTATALVLSVVSLTPSAAAAAPVVKSAATAVRIRVAFDRAIRAAVRTKAQDEARAIWRDNGVDIQWTDGGAEAEDSLDVIVERAHGDPNATQPVLGRVQLQRGEEGASGPIRIAYDAIEAILHALYGQRFDDDFLRNARIGTALGRVLAHEIGHVLLGPPGYHDQRGLMRPRYEPRELAGPERSPFRLTDQSFVRLRARLAAMTAERPQATGALTLFRLQHDALTPARE